MNRSGVGILPARQLKRARCPFHGKMPIPQNSSSHAIIKQRQSLVV
ncbi:MAG: hypothetical protein F6K37_03920 [Moorea sp. SIO4E2]|nr:hypothetical protein [Moorena sp. SIO4E2]NEQ05154.1 hypothetical protein [Moorena sp. SIO4E2]